MEMIIAVIVLAVATTVCFMNFVTLSKQINTAREENRAHWKSVEDSIDYQRNRLLKEIQEGKTFNDNAFVALNENITGCKTNIIQKLKDHDIEFNNHRKQLGKHINEVLEVVAAHDDDSEERSIKLRKLIDNTSCELVEKMNKSTRDINFITKQQAGRVITTPLKVMWEQYK